MLKPKMNRGICTLSAIAGCLIMAGGCFARETLFYKVSRNYDSEGALGIIYRQEFEKRMFQHQTWRQRLYCNPYEPDIDETLEVYSKADGTCWVSYHRATPSLSRIIEQRVRLGEHFALKKKLDAVRIVRREIVLPAPAAQEIELLWRTMLPGLAREPHTIGGMRVLVPHAPAIIAFEREGNLVKTGRIAMVAYDTAVYRAFMDVVDDLVKGCSRGGSVRDPIFERLPSKIRDLRAKLGHKASD